MSSAEASELLVAAASDLSRLMPELERQVLEKHSIRVKFVSGSSGQLARQIANGAPYDVFLSANSDFVNQLVTEGHVRGETVRTYARGRLGLWSRDGNIKKIEDLTKEWVERLAIANPAHAPYGLAARQMFEAKGLLGKLQPKIVLGENVRQALQYAESGNAEAVVTSWTLVFDRGGVLLPEEGHQPIVQAAGVTKTCRKMALGVRFLTFLCSYEGQKLLQSYGLFAPPAASK